MKTAVRTIILSSLTIFSAATFADYTQYCPTLDQLHATPVGASQMFAYTGTNNAGVVLKANTDDPQYIFNQNNTPTPKAIDSSLTTFIAISNTLRCDYTMINSLGYPVDYPLYNHGSYNQCPNGTLVLAGNSCN